MSADLSTKQKRPLLEKSSIVRVADVAAKLVTESATPLNPNAVGVFVKFCLEMGNGMYTQWGLSLAERAHVARGGETCPARGRGGPGRSVFVARG